MLLVVSYCVLVGHYFWYRYSKSCSLYISVWLFCYNIEFLNSFNVFFSMFCYGGSSFDLL